MSPVVKVVMCSRGGGLSTNHWMSQTASLLFFLSKLRNLTVSLKHVYEVYYYCFRTPITSDKQSRRQVRAKYVFEDSFRTRQAQTADFAPGLQQPTSYILQLAASATPSRLVHLQVGWLAIPVLHRHPCVWPIVCKCDVIYKTRST